MPAILRLPRPGRQALPSQWEIAPAAQGAAAGEAAPADGWLPIGAAQPLAAALAAAGQWQLDGPARRFDAEAWWYRLRFDAPAGIAAMGARLGLDGLATLATVWFNGAPVLSAANMFRSHEVALPAERWRARGNELLIRFDALDDALAPRRPRPRWRAPMVAQAQLRWIRTTLLGRTPGWSPEAAVLGPWRTPWLEPLAPAGDIAVVERRATLRDGRGHLAVALRLDGLRDRAAPAPRLRLARGPQAVEQALACGDDGLWRAELVVDAVAPWWPHTHGEPALYALELHDVAGAAAGPRSLGRVGFRTLAIDTTDGGFGLVVNGVPVFCRGACWVPPDPLRLAAAPAAQSALLARLAGAGLNMLRVGGTMVYEDAGFLAACDAAGVMVWQEFMCANMDYPADDPGFAAEIAAEAAEQLALWREHACIAVVCGNSEVAQQAAMWGADRPLWSPPLFHETLAAAVAAALPGVPWWPSSAHGGDFPFQPAAGTCSYYGVGAYLRPLSDARQSGLRFATECLAFAQVPDDAALERLAALQGGLPLRSHQPLWKSRVPRDLGAGWDFDDVRDHYLAALTGRPAAELRRIDPAGYWPLSRAACAETLAAAFAQWRDPASACRGALVWFLRDLRAGAGWGLLDECGHPKAAFHALRRAWAAQWLGLLDEGQNGITAVLANDRPEPLAGRLEIRFLQRGEVVVGEAARAIAVPAHGACREGVLAGADGFLDLNGSYRFGPPAADTVVARLCAADGSALLPDALLFLGGAAAWQAQALRPAAALGLQASAREGSDDGAGRQIRVRVASRAAARSVFFETPGWRPDDEYFHLAPGSAREVAFAPVDPAAPARWRGQVGAVNADGRVVIEGPR